MASLDSRIKPFQTNVESSQLPIAWAKWKRDLEAYFDSEGVDSQYVRRSKLLYLGGSDLRDIYDNLPETDHVSHVLSDPPYYDAAIAKLDSHFEPFRRRTYERHQFRQIAQKPSERFSDFVLRLRTQVKRCEYDKPDEMILDQIVEKCVSGKLRQKMLKKDMTLEEVEAVGTSMEESEKKLREFDSAKVAEDLNRVSRKTTQSQPDRGIRSHQTGIKHEIIPTGYRPNQRKPFGNRSEPVCFACGRRGHVMGAAYCPAKQATCLSCKRVGHFARQCRKRPNRDPRPEPTAKRIRVVQETDSENNKESDFIFYAMGNNTFSFSVGGVEIPMVIDSGAAANIINQSTWTEMKRKGVTVQNMITKIERVFTCYGSAEPMEMVGCFTASITGGGYEAEAQFYVAKKGQQCLLGDETAKLLHVLKVGFDVGRISEDSTMEFPKMKDVLVEIPVDPNIQPVRQAYRRVPYALEDKVEEKLEMLLTQGIIERVQEPSPWVSPMVPVLKDSGDVRLCIDMRRANKAILREAHPLPLVDELLGSVDGATVFSKIDIKEAYHQLEISKESRPITTFITKTGLYR
ncbi:uncharacterized protein K02A2.6-like isoform X2 [Aedes albopictus]|uniref:CCHC-type domain-containing protein n=1 Tax=Aedes albopictus TaxID=7160 RepID=A0ABM1Z1H3_AEDAL